MDVDNPRTPLLGHPAEQGRLRRTALELCGLESWKRRLPITIWLPKYRMEYLFRDLIAGVTVGLTSIPQGIAYAIIAGLPPQVGLYSSIFPGFVYMLLGSCKDVTVGPTAILAALLAKYVAKSEAFAYLAAFLSGCIIMLLGVLQLGFLLDFISKPVISGFTTAAALQIGASQLKSLFGITGSSGSTFISAVVNFCENIKTVQLWDSVLGVTTIVVLCLLKRAVILPTGPSGRARALAARASRCAVRARHALAVFGAALLAYLLHLRGLAPFALTGTIAGGLPTFGPPPFSAVVGNRTLGFEGMLALLGPEGLVMPLVAILESIAIARAFAGSQPVDATQEMLAVGACNVAASCCGGMPVTGSFTRTALNRACGVASPAGSMVKALLVLLSVTLLTEAFYFIPRAALAAVIVVAMASIIELTIVRRLWRNNKVELAVYCATVAVGGACGLEFGIAAGAAGDAARALAAAARPALPAAAFKVGHRSCESLALPAWLGYAGAGRVARGLRRRAADVLVLDGRRLRTLDLGVAESMVAAIEELEKRQQRVLLWQFPARARRLLLELRPALAPRLVAGASADQLVLGLDIQEEQGLLVN